MLSITIIYLYDPLSSQITRALPPHSVSVSYLNDEAFREGFLSSTLRLSGRATLGRLIKNLEIHPCELFEFLRFRQKNSSRNSTQNRGRKRGLVVEIEDIRCDPEALRFSRWN